MTAPVDVLAVMREGRSMHARTQGAVASAADGSLERIDAAIAAVAELIEANMEYDAAFMTYSTAKTGKHRNDAWARVQTAIDRRHAAMKRVGGGAS